VSGENASAGADHVTAVRAADDADALAIDPVEPDEILLGRDDVLEIHVAVLAVVQVKERLAVAARAAVVGGEHAVAVIHQMLNRRRVAAPALAARSAVHPHEHRHLVSRGSIRAAGRECPGSSGRRSSDSARPWSRPDRLP
jgi:hypothetical protein